MKIKMKHCLMVILSFVYLGVAKIYALEPAYCVNVKNSNISWVSGLNNNIRVLEFNGNTKYFKECKKKLNEKAEVERIINDYFDEYLSGKFLQDKPLLMKTVFENDNLNRFIYAGFLWNRNSNLSKYMRDEIDSNSLGINDCVAKKLNIDLKDFLLYASRELVQRCVSYDIHEGDLQTNLAIRQVSTYRLAKLLGIDNLVVKSDFVKLLTNHGEKLGVLTDKASGIATDEIKETDFIIDPTFQRDLVNLQILDTITNEQDHNPGNCFFKVKEGKLTGVEAFDNEGGFGLNTNLQNGLCWGVISPLLTEENKINLPHVSKFLAQKILATENDDIKEILKDLLSDSQIDSCIKRFNILKSALNNTISENKKFLLTDEEWSRDTMSEEISEKYGNTYLTHFLRKLDISFE